MYSIDKATHLIHEITERKDGYSALVVNHLLSQFGVGMVSLFGVVFIYQLSSSFLQGVLYILVFFGLERLVTLGATSSVGKAVSRFGYRWVMLFSLLALSFKLYLFTQVTFQNLWPLLPALVFGGLHVPSYYIPFHALFLDDDDDEKIGEQSGFLSMAGRLANVIAPFISGLLIAAYGFPVMFSVAFVVILVSIVPLFVMRHHEKHRGSYSFKRVKAFIKENPTVVKGVVGWTISDGMQMFLWPLYLFLVLGGYVIFGAVGSLVLIANSVAMFFAGKMYDRSKHKNFFVGTGLVVSATWFARFLSTTTIPVSISDGLNRFFSPLWWMKVRRFELVAGERGDSLVFGVAREYLVTTGYLTGLILGAVLLLVSQGIWILLILPAVASILYTTWVMKDE